MQTRGEHAGPKSDHDRRPNSRRVARKFGAEKRPTDDVERQSRHLRGDVDGLAVRPLQPRHERRPDRGGHVLGEPAEMSLGEHRLDHPSLPFPRGTLVREQPLAHADRE